MSAAAEGDIPLLPSAVQLFCVANASYWITSSARSRIDCGTVRPRALAVLRLITRSIFVICCTGRSAGFQCVNGDRVWPELPDMNYSITLSARLSMAAGTMSPSALAAFMLTVRSTLVDCCTGKWPGLSPLRIRPV